ncbi:MAG: ribonuclease HII [Deltaproteobacteria bacterium]|nr:ribonuclease HII [Deltaproteobacteria bacterium]
MARKSGFGRIAGVDEAGRGPLAGPVVAAAVVLPQDAILDGVRDSKAMTAKAREEAFSLVDATALTIGVGVVSAKQIDAWNILKASLNAMKQAVLCLEPAPDFLLVDGTYPVPVTTPHWCLVGGDRLSLSVSAASVVAKVYRDRIMRSYHAMYPQYGFLENKGYGTTRHLAAIKAHGACPIHRMTFRGVA